MNNYIQAKQCDAITHSILNFNIELTLLVLKTEYSSLGVNAKPADTLAPKVASASAGMVLALQDTQHVSLIHS